MKSKSDNTTRLAETAPAGETHVKSPFSRPIMIEQVPEGGIDFDIEADAVERAALAKADGLVGIETLEARFHVVPRPGDRFNVSGRVTASITQTCVVSLEPFSAAIAEDIDVDFASVEDVAKQELAHLEMVRAASSKAKSGKTKPDNKHSEPEEGEEDPPDPIIDGKIDLGTLAAEFLALGLDPYPRKPGVQFEEILSDKSETPDSPFAVLRKLDKLS